MNTIWIEQTTVVGRGGRPVPRWRFACPACGMAGELRSRRKIAVDAGDRHAREFCPRPGPIRVGVFEPDSPEWHKARAARLGGSEVAAVLGLSPWASEFSLWHAKTGAYMQERDNDEMHAGRVFEDAIAGMWHDKHPEWGLQRRVGTWVHARRDWQLANPDGLITMDGGRLALLEVKFALHDWQWGEPDSDDVPVYYRVQAQWYLDVFGLDEVRFAVFFGSSARFREYIVAADPDDQAMLRDAGLAFMQSVWSGDRPDIDGHDATYEVVKALAPGIDPMSVPVPELVAREFCAAKHAEKAAGVEAKRCTAVLAEHMGSAQRATWAGRVIANRQSKNGGVPYVVAARDLPSADEITLEATA